MGLERVTLGVCALALGMGGNAWAAPNILVIIADDYGADKFELTGDAVEHSPESAPSSYPTTTTLDALASTGITFTQAWAAPTCSPTRAAFLTGNYPHTTGVGGLVGDNYEDGLDRDSIHTIAETLAGREDPYATGLFGKWHLGGAQSGESSTWTWHPNHLTYWSGAVDDCQTKTPAPPPLAFGFDRFYGYLDGDVYDYTSWVSVEDDGTGSRVCRVDENPDVRAMEEAFEWIATQTRPWFAVVALAGPHTDRLGGPGYDSNDADDYCGFNTSGTATPGIYRDMVQCMDGYIDDFLYDLALSTETDYLASTQIIFFGDNGTPAAAMQPPWTTTAHDYGKGSVYETGIRVPLIIADGADYPFDEGGGSTKNTPVLIADLADTIEDLADGSAGSDNTATDGQSLHSCLGGACPTFTRSVYTETFDGSTGAGALITAANPLRKLILDYDDADDCVVPTLYAHRVDPDEETSLTPGLTTAKSAANTFRLARDAYTNIGWMPYDSSASEVDWCE